MARGRQARRRRTALRAKNRAARQGVGKALEHDADASAAVAATLEVRRHRRATNAGVSAAFEVTGSTGLPLSDRDTAWDAAAAAKSLDAADYPKAFFWHDQSKPDDEVTSYKLGFASKDGGTMTAVFRGVTAVAGALQGARGGVKGISAADTAGIKTRVEGYYKAAAKKFDDPDIRVPWEADGGKGETAAILLAYAETPGVQAVRLEDGSLAAMTVMDDAEDGQLAEYDERLAFWTAEFEADDDESPAATVEDAHLDDALAAMEEQLAAMPDCADCSHAYSDHLGAAGPCTIEDCDCTSYVGATDADGDDDGDAAAAQAGFAPTPEFELALSVIAHAGDDAVAYVREHLADAITAADDPVTVTIPDEHQPAARTPRRARGRQTQPVDGDQREPGGTADVPAVDVWNAILAPEGKLTSDRRAFAPDSITWRDLPLSLMAMTETSEGGHIGAELAGRIDQVWRDEAQAVADQYGATALIRGSGVFDSGGYGSEIARLVDDKTLRGVSVDLAIASYVTGPKSDWFDENDQWAPKEDAGAPSLIDLYSDDTIAVVLEAEIGMATVCPFQAFTDAKIATGDSLVAGANPAFWTVTMDGVWSVTRCEPCAEALAASALGVEEAVSLDASDEGLTASAAGIAIETPPAEWFSDPGLEELTPITVDDDGRIYGHAAAWGVCHLGFPGSCRTAPHSESGYTYFHLGEVLCDGGERLPCGQITLDTNHADLRLDRAAATAHYDHTGTVIAHVRCGEDEHGIWVAGAVMPDAPADKVRLFRGSKLSGDWRGKELVALLCVNVPGFPVPRAQALAASADGEEPEVVAMVAAGIPVFEAEVPPGDLERFRALKAHVEFAALADQAA